KDEELFFELIKKIECIEEISGKGKELYLHVCSDKIHDYDLHDIIGLFYRYKIDMAQLKRFLTDNNKKWFCDKNKFWYKKIFGK
ncbi:MAG TPA: hypothetical protein VEK38_00325, partial [Candidatus Bathyarchaeia archaeon]|nr:hypothetical protein [Candidatus Bathyarchaeia archaeon]